MSRRRDVSRNGDGVGMLSISQMKGFAGGAIMLGHSRSRAARAMRSNRPSPTARSRTTGRQAPVYKNGPGRPARTGPRTAHVSAGPAATGADRSRTAESPAGASCEIGLQAVRCIGDRPAAPNRRPTWRNRGSGGRQRLDVAARPSADRSRCSQVRDRDADHHRAAAHSRPPAVPGRQGAGGAQAFHRGAEWAVAGGNAGAGPLLRHALSLEAWAGGRCPRHAAGAATLQECR